MLYSGYVYDIYLLMDVSIAELPRVEIKDKLPAEYVEALRRLEDADTHQPLLPKKVPTGRKLATRGEPGDTVFIAASEYSGFEVQFKGGTKMNLKGKGSFTGEIGAWGGIRTADIYPIASLGTGGTVEYFELTPANMLGLRTLGGIYEEIAIKIDLVRKQRFEELLEKEQAVVRDFSRSNRNAKDVIPTKFIIMPEGPSSNINPEPVLSGARSAKTLLK